MNTAADSWDAGARSPLVTAVVDLADSLIAEMKEG